jgi:hypothetical protein
MNVFRAASFAAKNVNFFPQVLPGDQLPLVLLEVLA